MVDLATLQSAQQEALNRLNAQLPDQLRLVTARNYQEGSVAVIRSNEVVGLCFDNYPSDIIRNLEIDATVFPQLKDLVVRSTQLEEVPHWIKSFTQVENLILKSLWLSNIGALLEWFPNLKFLALPDNNLSTLPELHDHDNLYRLNLNRNQFTSIPSTVKHLPNLVSLMMDHNFLSDTPSELQTNILQAVSIENNQLSSLPEFLKDQPHLYNLDLSVNFISEVPEWFGHFGNLQYVNLSQNRIRQLPDSMADLTNLKLLELQYNPDLNFAPSILYSMQKLQIVNLEHSIENPAIVEKLQAFKKLFDVSVLIKV